jgi:hypothetical protein
LLSAGINHGEPQLHAFQFPRPEPDELDEQRDDHDKEKWMRRNIVLTAITSVFEDFNDFSSRNVIT